MVLSQQNLRGTCSARRIPPLLRLPLVEVSLVKRTQQHQRWVGRRLVLTRLLPPHLQRDRIYSERLLHPLPPLRPVEGCLAPRTLLQHLQPARRLEDCLVVVELRGRICLETHLPTRRRAPLERAQQGVAFSEEGRLVLVDSSVRSPRRPRPPLQQVQLVQVHHPCLATLQDPHLPVVSSAVQAGPRVLRQHQQLQGIHCLAVLRLPEACLVASPRVRLEQVPLLLPVVVRKVIPIRVNDV